MSVETTKYRRFGVYALIPGLALLLLATGCSEKEATTPNETAAAPQVAEPAAPESITAAEETQAAAETPADTATAAVDGQKIYQTSCQACHASGVAGAPKLGDKEAWVPRIAKGNDALLSSVTNGFNAMPPKGTCMSCSEDELRAAVEYMVGQGS